MADLIIALVIIGSIYALVKLVNTDVDSDEEL